MAAGSSKSLAVTATNSGPASVTVRNAAIANPQRSSEATLCSRVVQWWRIPPLGSWEPKRPGGTTNLANKRATLVIRADGTVVGHSASWISGDGLSAALQPGDMVVVPEKALGGPPIWKSLFQNAQILSSIATSVILAAHY